MGLAMDLIIFCRSGAVEQLRVHVRNLSMLGVNGAADSKGRVELFERGYGKDAAGISREAIQYFAGKVPVLGVCMGLECLVDVFGGDIG